MAGAGVVAKARREVPLPITHVVVDLEAEARETTGTAGTTSPDHSIDGRVAFVYSTQLGQRR